MNKSIKTMVISLLLILFAPMAKLSAQVSVWDGTWQPWTHGTGTEADPFLIENAQQLAYLAYRVNNGLDAGGGHVSNHDYHYKLMVDIDLNGSEDFQWTPIGYLNPSADYQCFGGCFNGNHHAISGLYINNSLYCAGFLGYTEGAIIMNLMIKEGRVFTSGRYAGGIIGYSKDGTIISNCSSSLNVTSNSDNANSGGIVGYTNYTTITNCNNMGNVSSHSSGYDSNSGGIVGCAYNTTITNCYNTGNLSANGASYPYGSSASGIINGSYNTVNNSYYLNTSGGHNMGGGQPLSVDAMKSEEFVGILNNGSDIWTRDVYYVNQGYPIFLGVLYMNVTTADATGITQTHAILNGAAYSTANHISSGFEYKKASDNHYQIINVSGSGNISTTLFGLEPNTQYQYHSFCTLNSLSTYYGEEKTFTTLPVSVTTNFATDITANSAILHGYMDIGDATLVSKGFEYRAVGVTDFTTVNVAGNDSDFDSQLIGLQLNTTYEYRAFINIAESPLTYYGSTKTFEVTWLNQDTICIYDVDMLCWVSEQCNSGITFEGKYIKLMNDITLPLNVPNNMTSIGVYPNYPFKGTFDGNGKLITNLYIDQPNTPYQGFFGYTLNAYLYNVGLVNITASGRNYTGGLVAYAENTYMRDCYVNGGTLFALSYCGGLVGYQEQGTNSIISGCYNTCEVTGNNYVGGLVGFSNYSTVRNSYVAAMVAAQGEAVGSIIGGANEVLMYYCYFNSELTGQTNAIGWNNTGKDGGEAMTSAQMRDPQFVATLNQGLTIHVWKQDYTMHINKGFPILQWQQSTGVDENDALAVAVYPNPANDKVTIEGEDIRHITISNLLGQTIFDGNASGNTFEYDFSKHKAGIYLIRIETASGVAVKKVSITR